MAIDLNNPCIFCQTTEVMMQNGVFIRENEMAYARWDSHPATPLHALIIPRRHAVDYFAMSFLEVAAVHKLVHEVRSIIQEKDPTVSGFNIGWNVGKTGGASVLHAHLHLLPRRAGDVPNPQGGIRHIFPNTAHYTPSA